MNENGMLRNKNFLTLLVEDDSAYQNYFLDSFLELTLFLVRYEFILSENKAGNYFFKRDFPPLGKLFSQNPNGARHLAPKYSRWLSTLNSSPQMTELCTSYGYDEKDRQIKTILPDGSEQHATFEIHNGRLIANSTDPLGNVSVQETDSHGNIVRVARKDSSGKQLTEVTYLYNEMGEMLKAFDAKGHPVTVEYDLLGRRTSLESLDSGRQEFFYDGSSNLVRENNSVLREKYKQIVYKYDGLNRLTTIDYPETKDTVYKYGGKNAPHGAAGKIASISDASGTLEYEYGSLGEVTKETRILNTHLGGRNRTEKAVMEYRSDYLGRMEWIKYPDGETVTYGYDNGGQVVSVTGEHWGQSFKYVTNILYDEYGQRTKIEYGNGTSTDYKYDPARRWLDTIKTQNDKGKTFQNIAYSFDAVGNVLGYENDCLDSASGNYKTSQTYSYDNLYQLIKVEGSTTYNPYQSVVPEFKSSYSQVFGFDSDGLGNMVSKVSSEAVSPSKSIGDNLNYNFNYNYDENYSHRLINVGERYYQYDLNGNVTVEQDGKFDEEPVTYHKINKEAEDVYSTDYGWGLFREKSTGRNSTATKYRRTYTWDERNQLVSSVDANFSTSYVYGQDGQRSNKYTSSSETLYFNKMWTLHTDSGNAAEGGQFAKNIYLGDTRIVTKLSSPTETTIHEEYFKQYYYHSDHLGSASLITDCDGYEYQRIEYTPYGETWVEKFAPKSEHLANLNFLPYKFTGKEMDEETGLYYYGSRYLDAKYSRWLSTDPALSSYVERNYNGTSGGIYNSVNLNLYHYGGNNPIRYVDPDGREDRYTQSITQYYIPEGNRNRPGTQITKVKGVVIHWTEAPKQSPETTIDYWSNRSDYGSAQYVISTKGEIYQAMPETEVAWHSGENIDKNYLYTDKAKAILENEKESSVNYFSIGIELEPLSGRGSSTTAGFFSLSTETAAVQLTAELLLRYKLNPDKDLYRHYDLTTKDCPLYYLDDERWNIFVEKVKAEMEKLGGIGNE